MNDSILNTFDAVLQKFFETTAESIVVVDRNGSIVLVNQGTLNLFGYTEAELNNQKIEILIPESHRSTHVQHRKEYYKKPRQRKMGKNMDLEAVRKDGTRFPVEVSLNYVNLEEEVLVIAFIIDITERKAYEEVIRKEEELAQTYFNQALSIFAVLTLQGSIRRLNQRGAEILGYRQNMLIGKSWLELFIPPANRSEFEELYQKLVEGKIRKLEFYEHEVITKTRKHKVLESSLRRIDVEGMEPFILLSAVDVTYKKGLENQKTKSMIEGQEVERRRIAKELHDGLGQSLSAMNLNMNLIEKEKGKLSAKSRRALTSLRDILEHTIVEVKSISYDLMPKILESYGLVKALKYLVDLIEDAQDIQVDFQVFGINERLPGDLEINLYRIAQELLNNSLKHSAAKNIQIQLVRHDHSLMLMVEDDGVGFETLRSLSDVKGLGLKNISTRVNALLGTFYIDSLPGKGTTVTIEFPFNHE